MEYSVLTLFPQLYTEFLATSLIGRASAAGQIHVSLHDLRDQCRPGERLDAPTFGHGAGMVIKPTVIQSAIEMIEQQSGPAYKIFFSPQGAKLTQPLLRTINTEIERTGHVLFFASRYEGVDDRVEQAYADQVISIGDYVLMGGDLPTMICLEGLLRLRPGVVGKQESVEKESFSSCFIDFPVFTEPVEWRGMSVPSVIRSGNHQAVDAWREQKAVRKSVISHFDWVRSCVTNSDDIEKARKHIPSHYIALLHDDIVCADGSIGTSSVTTLDIHDIARSAATYGIENYFIVTPLIDQQKIVNKLLEFWTTQAGIAYNKKRHDAVKRVRMVDTIGQVIKGIEEKDGKRPVVLVTSARNMQVKNLITYHDQEVVWSLDRPVLILLGTGQGIGPDTLEKADFTLCPVNGFADYNHLSVRSAAGIILDRWLGIQPVRR